MTVDVFRALHQQRPSHNPLVLPGPWDAVSAREITGGLRQGT